MTSGMSLRLYQNNQILSDGGKNAYKLQHDNFLVCLPSLPINSVSVKYQPLVALSQLPAIFLWNDGKNEKTTLGTRALLDARQPKCKCSFDGREILLSKELNAKTNRVAVHFAHIIATRKRTFGRECAVENSVVLVNDFKIGVEITVHAFPFSWNDLNERTEIWQVHLHGAQARA